MQQKFSFRRYLLVFLALILLFTLSLTAVFTLPSGRIESHVEAAREVFREEGTYPKLLFDTLACALDNYTDELMLETAIPEDPGMSALRAAMSMNDYARYWHGYQVFLRPALFLFSYPQIRYINIFLFFFVLLAALFSIRSKVGLLPCYVLVGALCAVYIVTLPGSLQYAPVFLITFLSLIVLLRRYSPDRPMDIALFFLVIGMVVNFIDLLTAPLVTLGLPLGFYLYLTIRDHPEAPFRTHFKSLFKASLAWGIGYGGCWACKWLLSSAVLGENIVADAAKTILFRSVGNPGEGFAFSDVVRVNVNALLAGSGSKMLMLIALGLALLVLLSILFFKGRKQLVSASLFLLLALYPFVWYAVLKNHSTEHFFFTFRIQIISVMALAFFFLTIIDTKKLAACLSRLAGKRAA